MAFLSAFAEQFQLSSNTIKLLKEEFDCEMAVLGLSEENIKALEGLKLGTSLSYQHKYREPGWLVNTNIGNQSLLSTQI